MDIKTKFNIGEVVFFLNQNKVQSSSIYSVEIYLSEYPKFPNGSEIKPNIIYALSNDDKLNEIFLFPSKEELLKSL